MQVKELGVVIGHGSNAADWDGKFLTEIATALATEGKIVFCSCLKHNLQGCKNLVHM